jgi:predicted outer membrane repeat protein
LIAPAVSQAANFQVTNTTDGAAPGPAGSLRKAISDANANSGADTITFTGGGASGTIRLTNGELQITDDVTITGPGEGALSISGDADSSNSATPGDSRIFGVVPPGTTPPFRQVTITGLTLTRGFAGSSPYVPGGAIVTSGTHLTLDHVTLSNNTANGVGGGLAQQSGLLDMTNSTVTGNHAGNAAGGVFSGYYGDEVATHISNTTITGNSVGRAVPPNPYGFPRGGGLSVTGGGTLDGLTVTGNTATETFAPYAPTGNAGGLALSANGDDIPIILRNSTVSGNSAASGGGGIGAEGAVIESTTVSGNQAGYGGGIYMEGSSVRGSTISGNTARAGGGVLAGGDSTGTIRNSTISGNGATGGGTATEYSGQGGGIFVYGNSKYAASGPAELRIRASTVAANASTAGSAGVYAFYDNPVEVPFVTLRGSIVADGSGAPDLGQKQAGSIASGFSLVENPGAVTLLGDPDGTSITGVDPKLGPLADNGGPTKTMALDPTSAAVDAAQAGGLTTDQRGQTRPVDSAAENTTLSDGTDMGAFEVQEKSAPGDDDVTRPQTKIKKAPKKLTLKPGKDTAKAKIKFKGSDDRPGKLSFECKLDKGKFEPCKSPLKLKLGKGKHVVEIRAVDAAGNVDKSPAKAKIKVGAAKKHKK